MTDFESQMLNLMSELVTQVKQLNSSLSDSNRPAPPPVENRLVMAMAAIQDGARTQKAIAKATGMSRTTVQRIEGVSAALAAAIVFERDERRGE